MDYMLMALIFFMLLLFVSIFFIYVWAVAGKTGRGLIKSKMFKRKFSGILKLHVNFDGKYDIDFVKIPKDKLLLIKKGKLPQDSEFAYLTKAVHFTHDGVTIYHTMDEVPFTVFLKKHYLNDEIAIIENLLIAIEDIKKERNIDKAREFKNILKRFLEQLEPKLKFIKEAKLHIEYLKFLDTDEEYRNTSPEKLLPIYKTGLYKLRDAIIEKNKKFINIKDMFEGIGNFASLKKILMMFWDNGFLAGSQGKPKENINWILIGVVVLCCILVIASIVMINKTNKRVDQVVVSMNQIKQMNETLYKYFIPVDVNGNTTPNNNIYYNPTTPKDVPPNPLGR